MADKAKQGQPNGQEVILGESKTVYDPMNYAIFNGQGGPYYFEIFTNFFNSYKEHIHRELLVSIDTKLKKLIKNYPSIASAYPKGLDFLHWLENPEQTPDNDYLLSAPVSCPMFTVFQLTDYALRAREEGSTPGEFRKFYAGATGKSQGIVAAVVIALSDSWDSFLQNAIKGVSLMLFIGCRVDVCSPAVVPSDPLPTASTFFEGDPSSTLKISELTLEQVEYFLTELNHSLPD